MKTKKGHKSRVGQIHWGRWGGGVGSWSCRWVKKNFHKKEEVPYGGEEKKVKLIFFL